MHNPSYEAQRPLWEALNSQNKERFLDYFGLKGVNASAVYAQWQAVVNTLKRGKEVVWQDIVSATQNLVTVVGRKA